MIRAVLVVLVAAGVMWWQFGGSASDPGGCGAPSPSPSPPLAHVESLRTEAQMAEESVAVLHRVLASVPNGGAGVGPGSDVEWSRFSRNRSSPGLFARMRADGEVSFRDGLLNPDDVYVDAASRATLNAAFSEANQKVGRLRAMRTAIAKEQILAMAADGRFVKWQGNAVQLAGRVSDDPNGEGWYTYMTADGTQYKVRWDDLTWTREAEQMAVALEMQIDTMIADFFVQHCGLSPQVRDVVLTYGLGDGPDRLRALATDNPVEYRRIRQMLIGR